MINQAFWDDLVDWAKVLLHGDERVLILVASARIDDDLRKLLKKVMLHEPGGADRLFDIDRPLGSFSSRILLSFRLGLIDREFESFLQTLRKLRNDAAHSTQPIRLDLPPHIDRVSSLYSHVHKSRIWPYILDSKTTPPNPKSDPKSCLYFSLFIAIANLEVTIHESVPIISEPKCHFSKVGVKSE